MKDKSLNIRMLFVILLFIFAGSSCVLAQNQTAYENKVLDIKVKYLSIFYYGYEKDLTMPEKHQIESLIKNKSEEQETTVLANLVMNYSMTHSKIEMDNLLNRFQSEMKIVEKFKTDVDLKREKEKKHDYTDKGSIQKNIKFAFLRWSQKGEFEKQTDYEVRLQNQSQNQFSEICTMEIKEKINSFQSSDLSMSLLTYDAEKEVFPTLFKFKKREWKNNQKISIDKAQNFKEKEWQSFQWQKEESSWCFIENDMFPSIIHLKSNYYHTSLNLPLPNQEEIIIIFNDLGIENLYLKGFIFNYSTLKKENTYNLDSAENSDSIAENENSIYQMENLEIKPEFPGGMSKFYKYISENYKIPTKEELRGKLIVSFVVEKDGSLVDIKVIRDLGFGTGKEAIRVLKESPKWNPGVLNGKKVKVQYSLPIQL